MLFRSLCVTIGDVAALSLIRLTMPRASANACAVSASSPSPRQLHRRGSRGKNRGATMEFGPDTSLLQFLPRLLSPKTTGLPVSQSL